MLRTFIVMLTAVLALPLANAATVDYDVGAAGKCYDADGAGGETELIVKSGSSPVLLDPVQAALAVVTFVDEPTETAASNGCSSNDAVDYLEVHASVYVLDGTQGAAFQACYAGNTGAILTTSCYPIRP